MRKWLPAGIGAAGLALALAVAGLPDERLEAAPGEYRSFVVLAGKDGAPPPPTAAPTPIPYTGPIASLYLGSAQIYGGDPIEQRGTHIAADGRETFDDPSHPANIAWYPDWGSGNSQPGFRGSNTVMAAHINYVGYGLAPFAHLTSAVPGSDLYLTMANGTQYRYTVQAVDVVDLGALDMDQVVFPALGPNVERVTLISCGGTFVPNPSGVGGHYNSRVILVAERQTD